MTRLFGRLDETGAGVHVGCDPGPVGRACSRSDGMVRAAVIGGDADAATVPDLFVRYGVGFADRVPGTFAAAVADRRGDVPLLALATDPVGSTPIYYVCDPAERRFVFASELHQLLASPAVSSEPWLPGLETYLATGGRIGQRTGFDRVRVLPPAATAVVDRREGLRILRRPSPDDSVLPALPGPVPPVEFAGLVGRTRDVLRAEVARLVGPGPVAVTTSGGLDSGLVAALAAELAPVHTMTLGWADPSGRPFADDERCYGRELAEHLGTTHHEVIADGDALVRVLPDLVRSLGEPNANPAAAAEYLLLERVRAEGLPVALTGDGADELFGGTARLRAAATAPPGTDWVSRYLDALAVIPNALRRGLYTAEYRAFVDDTAPVTSILEEQLDGGIGLDAQDGPAGLDALAGPGWHLAGDLVPGPLSGDPEPVPADGRLHLVAAAEAAVRLPGYALHRLHALGAAHGVSVRLPFCQPATVRHARALPPAALVDGDQCKRVLYGAAAPDLPTTALLRPPRQFVVPLARLLAAGDPLYAYARDVLSPGRLRRGGLLDPGAVGRLLDEQAVRPSPGVARAVWALLVHELWADRFGVFAPPAPVRDPLTPAA